MSARPVNPILKQVLELGPTLLFFLVYLRLKERTFVIGGAEYSGFIVATLIFVGIFAVGVYLLVRSRKVGVTAPLSPPSPA